MSTQLEINNIIADSGNFTALTLNGSDLSAVSTSIFEYDNPSNFPISGSSSGIYIATDSSRLYRWNGSSYNEVGPIGGADTSLWDYFKPPAPSNVTATAGDAQAIVSWTAPTVLSQTPITDYIIEYSNNSGSTWSTFSDGTGTSTSTTVSGLTNGTSYIFQIAATNAIGQGNWSTSSASITPLAGDPLYSSVSLLLHMDGTSSTFIDSSKYIHSVTAYGSTTQSTDQSRFGGKSALFVSDGDYLTLPDTSALELGSSNFAIEMWIRTTNSTQYATIMSRTPASFSTGMWSLMINHNSSTAGDIALYVNEISPSTPTLLSTGVNIRDGEWHYLVVSRDSSSFNLYVDGTRVATASSSATIVNISAGIRIGVDEFYGRQFTGNIDELRVTIGNSRGYTGTTISVPTAAFPEVVPNTDPWFSNVSLLLHGDGNLTDSSSYGHSFTTYGNVSATGVAKFGTNSLLFDGNGDYLMTSSNSAFDFPGDFTIEAWVWFSAPPNSYAGAYGAAIVNRYSGLGGGDNTGWQLRINGTSSGYDTINLYTGQTDLNWSASFSLNTWHHVAVSRSGSSIRAYVDGSQVGSTTINSDSLTPSSSRDLSIGRLALESTYLFDLNGRIDDLRLSKGVARYTGSSFSVPTAAFPNSE